MGKNPNLNFKYAMLSSESPVSIPEWSPGARVLRKYQLRAQGKEEPNETTVTTTRYKTLVCPCLEYCVQSSCPSQKRLYWDKKGCTGG